MTRSHIPDVAGSPADSPPPPDALLEAVLTGRTAPDSPEVAQRQRQDPVFARRLADLAALQGRLERALQEQRALKAKPELASQEARFKQLAGARLAQELSQPTTAQPGSQAPTTGKQKPVQRRPRLTLLAGLISAAAAILLYLKPWQEAAPDLSGLGGLSLGQDSAIEVTELRAEANGLVRLEANWPATPGCTYLVRIMDLTAPTAGVPLLELELFEPSLSVADLTWPPTASNLELTVEVLPPGTPAGESERVVLQRPSLPN